MPSHQPVPRSPASAQFGGNMGPFGLPPSSELPFAETAAPLTREEFEARAHAEAAAHQAHRPSPVVPAPRSSVPPPIPAPIPRNNAAPLPVPQHAASASGHPGGTAGAYAPQSHTSQPPPPVYGTTAAMPGIEQDPEQVPERAPRVLAGFLISYEVEPLGRFWPIYQGRNRLGRKGSGTELDIEIDHPTTSSRHALILAAACPGRLKLEDIGSTNGTLLNGVRITPGTRLELKDGDRIRFGLLSTIVKVV
jgi:hypothetical protein